MDRRLKILQQQFDHDMQLLESLQGSFKERMQEELVNLKFEIDSLKRTNQLQGLNSGAKPEISNRMVLA